MQDQLEEKLREVEQLLARDANFQRASALPRRWSVFRRDQHDCFGVVFGHLVHLADQALADGGLLPEAQLKAAFAAAGANASQLRLLLATKALLQQFGSRTYPALSILPSSPI